MHHLTHRTKCQEKSHFPRDFFYLPLVVSILFCKLTFTQDDPTGTISGKVVDSISGDPIPNVNIVITGTSIGTATNEEGEYLIRQIPADMQTVVFTHIGYVTHRHTRNIYTGSDVVYNVTLYPDHIRLEEVEIIGDTTDRHIRRRAAGSNLITGTQIERSGVNTFGDLVRHLIPLATVQEEGANLYISLLRATSLVRRYHGDNNPLIIIDGLRYGASPFGLANIVSVDRIEKLEVIRGPAAMRYGVDARHGVIIIDTKPSPISAESIFGTYKIIIAVTLGLLMFFLF